MTDAELVETVAATIINAIVANGDKYNRHKVTDALQQAGCGSFTRIVGYKKNVVRVNCDTADTRYVINVNLN